MNVRHPTGVLHSFSIKKIFYDKMDLKTFICKVSVAQYSDDYKNYLPQQI